MTWKSTKSIYNYLKMGEENINQKFRVEDIDEEKKYFIEEIEPHELTSKKHKKVCTTLIYIEHFLILASAVTECVSISAFTPLVGIPIGITISVAGLQICSLTATI